MKKTFTILTAVLIGIILLNIYLLFLCKNQALQIELQASQLNLGKDANEKLFNINNDLVLFLEKSFLASPFIDFDKFIYDKLQINTKNGPKLFVQINMDYCPPCINSLAILLKEIGDSSSPENIIILTKSSSKKELTILQNAIGLEYNYIQINPESIHIHNSEDVFVPYLFFWENGNKYPVLFTFYYKELIGFNEKYKEAAISYLNR